MSDFRRINREVMTYTELMYNTLSELKDAIRYSKAHQFMVKHEESIEYQERNPQRATKFVISGKRSFEAAKGYPGKKVAVLNFANNHSVGGAPYSAGAQEESLCRCSTLLPCLQAMKHEFYDYHSSLYASRVIDHMGNDDLIYTPGVVVFKTDERTATIRPEMMYQKDWYKVDVITSAAPELMFMTAPRDYEAQITSRIKKILDVAASQDVDVLILGAWGCGAFKNPVDVVAKVFSSLLADYHFETVEFALSTRGNASDGDFAKALSALNAEIERPNTSSFHEKKNHDNEDPISIEVFKGLATKYILYLDCGPAVAVIRNRGKYGIFYTCLGGMGGPVEAYRCEKPYFKYDDIRISVPRMAMDIYGYVAVKENGHWYILKVYTEQYMEIYGEPCNSFAMAKASFEKQLGGPSPFPWITFDAFDIEKN